MYRNVLSDISVYVDMLCEWLWIPISIYSTDTILALVELQLLEVSTDLGLVWFARLSHHTSRMCTKLSYCSLHIDRICGCFQQLKSEGNCTHCAAGVVHTSVCGFLYIHSLSMLIAQYTFTWLLPHTSKQWCSLYINICACCNIKFYNYCSMYTHNSCTAQAHKHV